MSQDQRPVLPQLLILFREDEEGAEEQSERPDERGAGELYFIPASSQLAKAG